LLTETQGKERFDLSLNIQADMPLRIARLKERGMYLAQIEARIAKQANDQERVEYCDFTIHNNGTKSSFADALKSFWNSEIEPRLKG
jgi:dephospho-CoA kinase